MSGYADGQGGAWGPTGVSPQWSFASSPASHNGVPFNPAGTEVVASGGDGLITVWNVPPPHALPVSHLAVLLDPNGPGDLSFASGGDLIVASVGDQGASDGGVGFWRAHDGRIAGPLTVVGRGNTNWTVSNNGTRLVER